MRTIREMLGNDEKVWVYLNGKETWEKFVGMAAAEGFRFGDLPVEKWTFGHVIAIHSNGDMGHLPLFVWQLSFRTDAADCPQKIDLRRYIGNYGDHKCRNSHFKLHI